MTKRDAKKLIDKLSKDTQFRDDLLAEQTEVVLKFAKKAGLSCSAEELREISGGGGTSPEECQKQMAQMFHQRGISTHLAVKVKPQ